VHAKHNPRVLWEVLQIVDSTSPPSLFLTSLLGPEHPNLQAYLDKYAGQTPLDIISDNTWTIQALSCFRTLVGQLKIDPLSASNKILFVKQVHGVRSNKKPKFRGSYPHGTPLLHMESVTLTYLDKQLVQEGRRLPYALINLEAFSYVCDFCREFEFNGDYRPVFCALRSSNLDAKDNYESLETLGDTVLKFLTSFHHFLIYKKDDEGWLTRRRTYIINNQFLAKIGCEQGIQHYLKSQPLPVARWQPPYFSTSEVVFQKTVVHRLSSGMIADTVEALIGAFYVSKGLLHAVEFIDKIGLIKNGADWAAVKSYCDYSSFELSQQRGFVSWRSQVMST
jgi:hypothetical protein